MEKTRRLSLGRGETLILASDGLGGEEFPGRWEICRKAAAGEVAAKLLETGIDYFAVNKRHFRTKTRKRLALEADMLSNMRFFHEGRGVFMSVPIALMDRIGATENDAEDLSALANLIEGVDCGVVLREQRPNVWKVSLRTGADGRVTLMRAKDRAKDQSYFLYRVDRETLKRTIFPLGGMTKSEVREYASGRGIKAAGKTDSQDFCGGDVLEIAGAEIPGDIVDMSGRKLGRHRGFWHYTIGKRKGLGIGGGTPYYVVALNAARNEVVVGFKEDTVRFDFDISDVVGGENLQGELAVKIRSGGEPKGPVTVKVNADGSAKVSCASGISGIAPGQSAVFYRGDEVIGGGIILANT
jgi:hypothetical protein